MRFEPAYRRILLTRYINNKKHIAPLTLNQVLLGQWHGLFQLPQNSNAPTMRLNTLGFLTSTPMNTQMGGRENDNCVGLKLAKNTCVVPGVGPSVFFIPLMCHKKRMLVFRRGSSESFHALLLVFYASCDQCYTTLLIYLLECQRA